MEDTILDPMVDARSEGCAEAGHENEEAEDEGVYEGDGCGEGDDEGEGEDVDVAGIY